MTPKEIHTQLLNLREEALRTDEILIGHVKAIHQRLDGLQHMAVNLARLASVPDSEEKQEIAADLGKLDFMEVQDRAKRLVAVHESKHERMGCDLENLRKIIGDLRDD